MTRKARTDRRLVSREELLRALMGLFAKTAEEEGGRRSADREDALMDAILRALEAADSEEPPRVAGDALLARRYASRVVQNALIDRLRQAQRLPTVPLEEAEPVAPQEPGVEEDAESKLHRERRVLCEQLVAELDTDDEALLTAYLTGPDRFHDEASQLGIEPGTARVRIHRILKRLRSRSRERRPGLFLE